MRAKAWAGVATLLLAVWAASLGQAGTADDPEITDPAADHQPDGQSTAYNSADILKVWIHNETVDSVTATFALGGEPGGGFVGPVGTTFYTYTLAFNVSGEAYAATVTASFDDGIQPGGAASNVTVNGTMMSLLIPKENIGNATAGMAMTNLTASSSMLLLDVGPLELASDTAPDEGFGRDYNFTVGATSPTPTSTPTPTPTATPSPTTTPSPTATPTPSTNGSPTYIPPTTSGGGDGSGAQGQSVQDKLLDGNYFPIAAGLMVLLIILAAIGLKRWSL